MTPNRVVAIWLASFTPAPHDAWRSSSPSIGAFRPSPSSFRLVRYYSPSPPRRGILRLRSRGRRNIHVSHLSTTNDDADHDGGKGGCFSFSGYARIAIERIALDDVVGLERMSEFCVSGFYDDCDGTEQNSDVVGDGSTLSR